MSRFFPQTDSRAGSWAGNRAGGPDRPRTRSRMRSRGRTRTRAGNNAAGFHDWLAATAPDVPRTDLPKPFRGGRVRLGWVRAAVGASLVLVPVLAIALVVNLSSRSRPGPAGQAPVSSTEPVAAAAVVEWLQRQPSPVPGGGQLLAWNGDKNLPRPSAQPAGTDQPATLVVHSFSVLSSSGQLFTASVVTATTPQTGTVAVSDPSLTADPPASQGETTPQLWPTLDAVSPTDAVNTAIKSWASAYTSGDPAALRQAIGDPDASHSYMPLTGVVFTSLSDSQAGAVWGQKDPASDQTPPAMVVRVDVSMYWLKQGQTAAPPDLTDDDTAPASFDVLVEKSDTASPVVTAWGAAGSGELLRDFQNAVAGRQLTTSTAPPGAGPSTPTTAGTDTPTDTTPGTTTPRPAPALSTPAPSTSALPATRTTRTAPPARNRRGDG